MIAVLARWAVVAVLVVGRDAGAVTSDDTWRSLAITRQNAAFDVIIGAIPDGTAVDGVIGLSAGPVDDYDDLAVIVRFNDGGTIDVRDGDDYRADATVAYDADTAYAFRLEVDVSAHIYSVWVTPEGETETAVAIDYDFRTEQASVTALAYWATVTAFGTMEVDLWVAASEEFIGVIAAGCEPGEYYDLTTETCETPRDEGCAAVAGAPLVILFVVRRRR